MNKSQVSITRCKDYEREHVKEALSEALSPLGGMGTFIEPGSRVLIKPNLIAGTPPERGATTHPEVLRAVIEEVRSVGGKPIVGESPGFESFHVAASKSGLLEVLEEMGVDAAPFETSRNVPLSPGHIVTSLPIAEPVVDADAVISLPKLKSHGLVMYTGCVKNMFGVICGSQKGKYHLRFQDRELFSTLLAEIYATAKPTLSILDGIIGMDGNGPRNGDPFDLGIIMAGSDGVAIDAVACSIVGINPVESPPLRIASEKGYGTIDLGNIDIYGPSIEELQVQGFRVPKAARPSMRQRLMSGETGRVLRNWFTTRPSVVRNSCRGCRVCARACPADAIEIRNGVAHMDYDKCIRCYCCQELCEYGAITLKTPPLARIFQ